LAATLSVAFQFANQKDNGDFPDGFDAVQAAPGTHKLIFENSLVRVLEVSIPPAGSKIPMHHHRWPSFFLSWDTGGKSPHVLYRRPDGSINDQPSKVEPVHEGSWAVRWMKPEPMHSIEVVESPSTKAGPSDLRIEIKCSP
jgi:hypothetical protein